jgi:hypothetical protein
MKTEETNSKIPELIRYSYGLYLLLIIFIFIWLIGDMWRYDGSGKLIHLTVFQSVSSYISSITICAVMAWVPVYLYKSDMNNKRPLLTPISFIVIALFLLYCFTAAGPSERATEPSFYSGE